MSFKSSSMSYTSSSGGETRVSSFSSGSSSRRRRAPGGEPGVPPATMTSLERLQHCRNAITRLEAICERHRQTERVNTTTSDREAQRMSEVFQQIRDAVPKLAFHPKWQGSTEDGPRFLANVKKRAEKLMTIAHQGMEEIKPTDEKTLPNDLESSETAYRGLHRKYLEEAHTELHDLHELLSKPPEQQLSRINRELLDDLVAIHIQEFDAFMDIRIQQFIAESLQEHAYFSYGVSGGSISSAACAGVLSVVLLDVAVGVRPGKNARMVIEHAQHIIRELESRVTLAANILRAGAETVDSREAVMRLEQLTEYTTMKTRITAALSSIGEIATKWAEEERTTFSKAIRAEQPLQELLEMKRIREDDVIASVQMLHDTVVQSCLPFAVPQYYRRNSKSYTQPCHIRIGFHLLSNPAEPSVPGGCTSSLLLPTLMPEFYSMLRSSPQQYVQLAELAPSSAQIWVNFGEFPEMVRGSRCALRRADPRADYPRALEEHKEVGGYFLMGGGERILRALLMQRTNIPINIEREKFSSQGRHFSSKAVVIRCKRPSGLTLQNYLYYTTDGEVIFSFSRKMVWHVPYLLLLHSMNLDNLSSVAIFQALSIGCAAKDHASHVARVEALLQHHRSEPYGHLTSALDYLAIIGQMYRAYHHNSGVFTFLPAYARESACQHDAWYGMFMLRRHVLPHLNEKATTPDLPPGASEKEVLDWLTPALQRELRRKFDTLLAMGRQLYGFVDGTCSHQGNDVPAYQEVITVSQVLIGAFEVCVHRFLRNLGKKISTCVPVTFFQRALQLPKGPTKDGEKVLAQLRQYCDAALRNIFGHLSTLTSLLTTGNFNLDREEDFYCPQTAGFVVMAEHLNFYRFFEQLRCIHRGQTIAQMRSSEVRKYPCESYGFICMVHSPDGEDCGVSNYLSISTIFSSSMDSHANSQQRRTLHEWLREELPELAEPPVVSAVEKFTCRVPVWLEGEVLAYVTPADAAKAAEGLRRRKQMVSSRMIDRSGVVSRRQVTPLHTLEVVCIPTTSDKDPPGLYIFVDCGRLLRPVQVLRGISTQPAPDPLPFPLVYVGTWEQSWLNIASVAADVTDALRHVQKTYTYMEQNGSNLISFTSTTIPFFEYNCSPRNLFQCGLSKQSSGTQLQALAWRKEAKLFRTYVPQRYISRTLPMDFYNVDDVNLGVNAVVAILAYTGYDMDDAVIMNSCASQRGMLNAGITVAKIIKASGPSGAGKNEVHVFHNVQSTGERFSPELNPQGLPYGRLPSEAESFGFEKDHTFPSLRNQNDVYCCALRQEHNDPLTKQPVYTYSRHKTTKWRHFDKGEDAWVHKVVPLEFDGPDPTVVLVVFRIPRPPTIGDKFSSRHGQKGTLPLQIRSYDLPFSTSSGITPDVLINPHAFPSRMTVGMVLEIMVAKVGALEGRFMDNSAWSVVDDRPVVAESIGEALASLGFNRYGRESLIDGISGEPMEADVFMGISGYQRLRHQVNDKWQARARTDSHKYRAVTKTGQPVKGRKNHGGVRIGEMERDALLSHGMSEVVLDRLLHVSDKTKAYVCPVCGDILSIYERHATEYGTWKTCRFCGTGDTENTDEISLVEIPQVLRLWAAELTSVGIRVALRTSNAA